MHKLPALASAAALLLSCSGDEAATPPPVPEAAMTYIADDIAVPRDELHRAIAPLFDDAQMAETRALLVMHRGEIVAERYGPGYDAESKFISWSMAKSVTAALVGFMVADGRLVLDDPAPVPAWQRSGDPRGDITLRHLLHMSSGLDHTEVGPEDGQRIFEGDTQRMLFLDGADDVAGYAAAQPMEAPPGAKFEYSTATTMILADIITRTLTDSSDPDTRRLAAQRFIDGRLFEPLGMEDTRFEYDARGTFLGGSILQGTARDYATFGEFLRHNGSKKGAQHLPVSWVQFMRAPSDNDPAYGAHLWLNRPRPEGRNAILFPGRAPENIFAALGHLGQQIVVSPDQKLTIVRLGKTQDDAAGPATEQIARIVNLFPA